jgi:hypothetical protein
MAGLPSMAMLVEETIRMAPPTTSPTPGPGFCLTGGSEARHAPFAEFGGSRGPAAIGVPGEVRRLEEQTLSLTIIFFNDEEEDRHESNGAMDVPCVHGRG